MANVTKLNVVRRRNPTAGAGGFGAVPHDTMAIRAYSKALKGAIQDFLGGADYFTREDLLHLDVFDHVSTISRYRYLCLAVRELVNTGDLVEMGRYHLALPAKTRFYTGASLHDEYIGTIRRIVKGFGVQQSFSVMDIVRKWKSDPHLTDNVKRAITRRVMTALTREGAAHRSDDFTYFVEG